MDRIMKVTMALASELYVTRDRLRCLEFMLEEAGQLDRSKLDQFEPSKEQELEIRAEREKMVENILSPVTAPQPK